MLQASRYFKGIKVWCIATLDHGGFFLGGSKATPKGSWKGTFYKNPR